MHLEIRKLIEMNIFNPLDESARQVILADHLDKSRIRIAAGNHGQPRLPLAPVTQPHACCASVVVHENLFNVMYGADLTAAMYVSPLQYLRDRMGPATRQLRLFVAGNRF